MICKVAKCCPEDVDRAVEAAKVTNYFCPTCFLAWHSIMNFALKIIADVESNEISMS